MKKISFLILLTLALFSFSACVKKELNTPSLLNNLAADTNSYNVTSKDYYESFRQKCNMLSGSKNCCLSSVNNAELVQSLVFEQPITEVNCPTNTQATLNKCLESYKWCEPIKNK
jgi:hypothetical protein